MEGKRFRNVSSETRPGIGRVDYGNDLIESHIGMHSPVSLCYSLSLSLCLSLCCRALARFTTTLLRRNITWRGQVRRLEINARRYVLVPSSSRCRGIWASSYAGCPPKLEAICLLRSKFRRRFTTITPRPEHRNTTARRILILRSAS